MRRRLATCANPVRRRLATCNAGLGVLRGTFFLRTLQERQTTTAQQHFRRSHKLRRLLGQVDDRPSLKRLNAQEPPFHGCIAVPWGAYQRDLMRAIVAPMVLTLSNFMCAHWLAAQIVFRHNLCRRATMRETTTMPFTPRVPSINAITKSPKYLVYSSIRIALERQD